MAAPRRLLLVGWETADWKFLHALIDVGTMPALSDLVNEGASGRLAAPVPLEPLLLWTSLATGKTADQHSILGPWERDPATERLQPVTSASRRVQALWQIAATHGLKTHVIGWPGTHPAEPGPGVHVSPMYARLPPPGPMDTAWPLASGSVLPKRLEEHLADLRLHPAELPAGAIQKLAPLAARVSQRYDERLSHIASAVSVACSVHNAATWALENEPWDVATVCYPALAWFSQQFMPLTAPRMGHVSEADFEVYGGVLEGFYQVLDLFLGRLVDLAGPECTVALVSPYGYRSRAARPAPGTLEFDKAETWRTPEGLVCIRGNGIAADALVAGAGVLDVVPTLLHCLGLPVAGDMTGRVMTEAFGTVPNPERVPSFESGCATEEHGASMNAVGTLGLAEQFAALARYDAPSGRVATGEAAAAEQMLFHLVSVYMSSGRPAAALPHIEQLAHEAPEEMKYQRTLAQCYLATDQIEKAEELLNRLAEGYEAYPWIPFFLGIIHMHRKELDRALEQFGQAESQCGTSAELHAFIANVYLAKRMWKAAGRSAEAALALDAESAAAQAAMGAVRLREGREEDAVSHCLEATRLRFEIPSAHYYLGVALARRGQYKRAVVALEAAKMLAPGMKHAERMLVRIRATVNPILL